MVAPRAMYDRPIPERHRIVFYLGHLEAFDWNMIGAGSFGRESFNSTFDRLFQFGIDPVDGGLPQDAASDWPSIKEIMAYNGRARSAIDDLLERADFDGSAGQPFLEDGQIFHVAIEHRLMHAETLAYMLHWLDFELKNPEPESAGGDMPESRSVPPSVEIGAGEAVLGQDRPGLSFGWDNEFPARRVLVPEFTIDTFKVTNAQFLEFMLAGGYEERSLWADSDWDWIQTDVIRHPKFWLQRGSEWFYRTMFEERPLPALWPVYVSHAEASAYARWKGKLLPSESQYQRAAFGSPDDMAKAPANGNYDFRSWSPDAAGAAVDRSSAFGVHDLVGNGWEWTNTRFAPFEGFEPFPFYPGYSADFFDGKHFVMKGASPRTAAALIRPSFRNWFQPHYPNVYAGFRCVQS